MQLLLQIASKKYTNTAQSNAIKFFAHFVSLCYQFYSINPTFNCQFPLLSSHSFNKQGYISIMHFLLTFAAHHDDRFLVVFCFVDNGKITNVLNTVKVNAMSADPSHNSNVTNIWIFFASLSNKTKQKEFHTHTLEL